MRESRQRRVAVLGGAGGIGRALVDRLARMGDEVVILDLAASLKSHPSVHTGIAIDVRSEESVRVAFASLGETNNRLDGLVCLSGYRGDRAPIEAFEVATYDAVLDTNLRGTALACRAALPLLRKGHQASVVLTASALAHVVMPGYGAYSISKAGLIALGKTLAVEIAPQVRVNIVAPSAVDTAFLRGGTGRSDESSPISFDVQKMAQAIPLQRLAEPRDVVGPVVFLLGEDSAYMTGQVLWVTGGSYMP